ncbi:hypothetical protein J3459_017031 [Metarhizium acridum]|uniref:uncharacterized protein n=1 Tax=Metarhizium acridum TaxID=92637 RepID=UPI001C6BC52D|nr:hypothetical protein J3459_017031 [Metarhizium acridum]KAG8411656.1 hypothetical protein J3458_015715 [Metarhizium acridum]
MQLPMSWNVIVLLKGGGFNSFDWARAIRFCRASTDRRRSYPMISSKPASSSSYLQTCKDFADTQSLGHPWNIVYLAPAVYNRDGNGGGLNCDTKLRTPNKQVFDGVNALSRSDSRSR